MPLEKAVFDEITDFLMSYFVDAMERRALVTRILQHLKVIHHIEWQGTPYAFTTHLITTLDQWGKIENNSLLEQLLFGMLAEVGADRQTTLYNLINRIRSTAGTAVWNESPFPGLQAFQERHKPIFFGREQEIARLVQFIEQKPLVTVIGASGSGKSSLLRAGVINRLKESRVETWNVLHFMPDQAGAQNPFISLRSALVQIRQDDLPSLEQLAETPTLLKDTLSAWLPASHRLLLLVDQFEETFTTIQPTLRPSFIQALCHLLDLSHVHVVLTLRSDFFHHCLNEPNLRDHFSQSIYLLLWPHPLALHQMIAGPAAVVNLKLEDDLIGSLLRDTGSEAGNLALLAYTLSELYRRADGNKTIGLKDYEALGDQQEKLNGVQGAIGKRAEEIFSKFSMAAKETLLTHVFRELVEVSDSGAATRRRVPLDHFEEFEEAEKKLVDTFLQSRLLVSDNGSVEVIHEALFRSWKWLRDWIDANRRDLTLLSQVRSAAYHWHTQDRQDYLLWPQKRLAFVYDMQQRLKPKFNEIEKEFIASAQDHSLQEDLRKTQAALSQSQKLYDASHLINTSQRLEDLVLAGNKVTDSSHLGFWLALPEGRRETDGWSNQTRIIAKSVRGIVELANDVHTLLLPSDCLLRDGEPATIIDKDEDENTASESVKWLRSLGLKLMVIFPLYSNNILIALFYVVSAEALELSPDDYNVYRAVTGQMSTQIQNRSLLKRTEQALNETGSLYNATTNISRAYDLEVLADAIETALTTLHPDMIAGYLQLDSAGQSIKRLFSMGFEMTEAVGVDMRALVTLPVPDEETVYIPDLKSSEPSEIALELLKDEQIQAFVIISLRVKDIAGARLMVGYRRPFIFGEGELRFITSISDSASVVVDNQMLLEQIQSTLQETSVLYQASRALFEATEASDVIAVIAAYLVEPHINQVFIAQLNTTSWYAPNATIEITSTWRSGSEVDLQGVTLTVEQFPAWRLLATEIVIVIQDIYSEDFNLSEFERISIESMDTRSLVIIPLRVGGRAIGAIWLGSQQPHAYTDQNMRVFQAFAEQTSLSMEASRSLAQAERRTRQLETSASISRNISELLDLGLLLSRAVDLIRDTFRYEHVQVFLIDEKSQYAVLRASTGEAGRRLLGKHHRIAVGGEGVVGRVTLTGQPTIVLDTADVGVLHVFNPDLPYTRCELAIPLIINDRVVGALDVQSNLPNAFTDEDIQALSTLAAQISVAIGNARLMKANKVRVR